MVKEMLEEFEELAQCVRDRTKIKGPFLYSKHTN